MLFYAVFEDGGQIIFLHIYNKALFFERMSAVILGGRRNSRNWSKCRMRNSRMQEKL